jgi:GrpB-like predicted nucleotidyltransferase (UPF0157 family)
MESREEPGAGSLGPGDGVDLHRIVGHRAHWRGEFSRLAGILAQQIPDVVAVEHIGSTAIPGMPARDILDLEVIVTRIEKEAALAASLQRLGFRRFNPPDLAVAGLRLFVPDDGSGRVHVHVCERGSAQHRRHVAVRDYLRAHPAEARRYAEVKREAARLAAGSRVAYSRAKTRYLQALEQTALRWNKSRPDH